MLTIRDAKPEDLAALIRVRNTPDLFRENLQQAGELSRRFLICQKNRTIVGFCQLRFCQSPNASPRNDFPKISDLFIAPAFRSQGIGSFFVSEMESIIRQLGYHWMYLGVDAENPRAVAFYKRLGYVQLQDAPYPRRAVFHEEPDRIVERVYWRLDMAKSLLNDPSAEQVPLT